MHTNKKVSETKDTNNNQKYRRYAKKEETDVAKTTRKKVQGMHPLNYWCGPHAMFHLSFSQEQ